MLLVPVMWLSLWYWLSLYCGSGQNCGCPCTGVLVPVLRLSLHCYWSPYCGCPCTVILAAPVLWYWSLLGLSLYSSTGCPIYYCAGFPCIFTLKVALAVPVSWSCLCCSTGFSSHMSPIQRHRNRKLASSSPLPRFYWLFSLNYFIAVLSHCWSLNP